MENSSSQEQEGGSSPSRNVTETDSKNNTSSPNLKHSSHGLATIKQTNEYDTESPSILTP